MHLRIIGFLLAFPLLPAPGFAQTAPQTAAVVENSAAAPPTAAPSRPTGITREQYLQRAQERAAQRAGVRFDEMDTDHDGVLDRAEIRAWRSQHPRRAAAQPAAPAQQ